MNREQLEFENVFKSTTIYRFREDNFNCSTKKDRLAYGKCGEMNFELFCKLHFINISSLNCINENDMDFIHAGSNTLIDVKIKKVEFIKELNEYCVCINKNSIVRYRNRCNEYHSSRKFTALLAFDFTDEDCIDFKFISVNKIFNLIEDGITVEIDDNIYFSISELEDLEWLEHYLNKKMDNYFIRINSYSKLSHILSLKNRSPKRIKFNYKSIKNDSLFETEKEFIYVKNLKSLCNNTLTHERLTRYNCLIMHIDEYNGLLDLQKSTTKPVYLCFYIDDEGNELIKEFRFLKITSVQYNYEFAENKSVVNKNDTLLNLCKDDFLTENKFFQNIE